MQMRELKIFLILSMTFFVMSESKDETSIPHHVKKREALSSKERNRLQPSMLSKRYSPPEVPLIHPPPFKGFESSRRRMSKNHVPQGSLHGYLSLVPVPQHDNRNPKRIRAQDRIMTGYSTLPDYVKQSPPPNHRQSSLPPPRPTEELGFGEKLARWFFSADDDSSEEEASTEVRKNVARPPPGYRPNNYENFPPFWDDNKTGASKSYPSHDAPSKTNRYLRPKSAPAPNRSNFKYSKKDCNPCNSVPWTPIWKSSVQIQPAQTPKVPVDSYGVPLVEVIPGYSNNNADSAGYSSSQQASVVPAGPAPAPVVENSPDTTISNSYGLPVGNIPTGHGLLAPVNPLASIPSNYNPPGVQQTYLQATSIPIPFPQLSAIPLAPIHNHQQFSNHRPETNDLVPPIPPRSISNVIFTISEQAHDNNHIEKGEHQSGSQHSTTVVDQSSEPSSLIDSHAHHQDYRYHGQRNHNNHNNGHNNGGLDIVKSVPLAEYTSSIEYPLQVIQSSPYIDITTSANTTTKSSTYEKEPQTGNQKVSDIILGSDNKKAATDSLASGSAITEQRATDTTSSFSETSTPSSTMHDKGSSPFFIEVRPSDSTVLHPTLQAFQNSYHQQHGELISNPIGHDQNLPFYAKDWLDPNILTPPPAPPSITQLLPLPGSFELPGGTPTPYLNPPRPTKESPSGLLSPSSTAWLLPAQSDLYPQWLLPAASSSPVPYPFNLDQGIASVINGGLLPPPPAQPLNTKSPKTKKIQIIIPYTTINSDQNTLETVQKSKVENESLPESERANTWLPMVTEQTPQGRKIPNYQNFDNFKNVNWNEGQHSETSAVAANASGKYYNEIKHIIATNIKELLTDEVEKPKTEQNLRLQKNIDNWTALEYSNHKITTKKEPQDVITHAQAVTSIPGTSISHLLLPSKKIPKDYLTTTPIPHYDEPETTTPFATSSSSVESKPFTGTTKTLMTASMYSTVSRNGLFTTTPKPETKTTDADKRKIFKININKLEQIKQQNIRNSQLTNFANQENHRNGYSEVTQNRGTQWGKLNENLIVPEDVSGKPHLDKFETTTTGPFWPETKISISSTNEKVYVVTPVSSWEPTTGDGYKRTTRHVSTTEKYNETTTRKYTPKIDRLNNKITRPYQNFTKLEKITSTTKTANLTLAANKTQSTQLFKMKNETLSKLKVTRFNKPKPIEKFYATTKAPGIRQTSTVKISLNKNKTRVEEEEKFDADGKPSLNDIFPFRNGGELPLEMSKTNNLNKDEVQFKNTGERKTLIKQVKISKKDGKKYGKDESTESYDSTTATGTESTSSETGTTPSTERDVTKLEVDVLLPHNDSTKAKPGLTIDEKSPAIKFRTQSTHIQRVTRRLSKEPKPTPDYRQLKNFVSKFNPDEPNITEDEREKINSLPAKPNKRSGDETLIAVESKLPNGVFGETTKVESKNENQTNYSSIFGPEKIQETIRLLKEFLSDPSDESSSLEKTETNNSFKINKNFTEYDKLLDRLETLKPMLNNSTSVENIDTKMNVTENLKNIENKLLKKFNEHGQNQSVDDNNSNNLPKSSDDLSLNKHEIDLVEGAMVELRKNQKQKNLET